MTRGAEFMLLETDRGFAMKFNAAAPLFVLGRTFSAKTPRKLIFELYYGRLCWYRIPKGQPPGSNAKENVNNKEGS